MKIGAAQTHVSSDIAANGHNIRTLLQQAAAQGIRLVSFCEGALSGYAKAQLGKTPEGWKTFDWQMQEQELNQIAELCKHLGIFAVIGAAHRLEHGFPPHNSLYVFSDTGALLGRYDKRLLSHSELEGWYTPGSHPTVFEVDGFRFGCAICIESQFPEVFMEYEQLEVDAVIFSSYGIPDHFQRALQAHAGLNCLWITVATPAQTTDQQGMAGIIGPDGLWASQCTESMKDGIAVEILNKDNINYDIPLKKARPWRKEARKGDIYREKLADTPRSKDKSTY